MSHSVFFHFLSAFPSQSPGSIHCKSHGIFGPLLARGRAHNSPIPSTTLRRVYHVSHLSYLQVNAMVGQPLSKKLDWLCGNWWILLRKNASRL